MTQGRVRFGIVGTGRISDWVLKGALQDPRFEAVAVCSRSRDNALRFVSAHPEAFSGGAEIFTDIRDICACPGVDAIYIGTPNSTHLPYTLEALRAGKHVLCEKPLGCSLGEVEQMTRAARDSGKVLMEAMISTLNPNFRTAVSSLAGLGKVRHYSSTFCQYSSKYEKLLDGVISNSFDPDMGGGALEDIGIYTTYPLVALFGEPAEVHPDMVYLDVCGKKVNVQGSASMRFEDGMTACIAFSKAADSFLPTEICAEGGNLILNQIHISREVTLVPHGAPTSGRGPSARGTSLCSGLPKDEYFYEFEEFINVISSGALQSRVNTLDISLANSRLMDRIKGLLP